MPLHWTILHRQRLVLSVARNEVTFGDIDRYLTALAKEHALPYRKVFDVTHATHGVATHEIQRLAERVGLFQRDYVLGPVAIVAGTTGSHAAAQHYASNAIASRPMAVFRDMPTARRWIDGQKLPFGTFC